MDDEELIDHLRDLAEGFGYVVRMEALDSDGGGCIVSGKRMLFVDVTAPGEIQIETFARVLIDEDLDAVYLIPQVRQTIERLGHPRG